tara:strand:+ start:1708 stop:1944 length:237 start_codon:yes stop_codon:yes gene_type:complete
MSNNEKEDTVLFTEEEIKEIKDAKDRLIGPAANTVMSADEIKAMMSEIQDIKGDVNSMISQAQLLVQSIQPIIDKMDK